MYKVALADDHVLIRNGLASLINTLSNFEVIFEADNGKQLLEKLAQENLPDIILLDVHMPEMDGYETALCLKQQYPDIKVIVVSFMDDEIAIIRMLRNGGCGYLLKSSKPDELKYAMESVLSKGYYFNDLVSSKLINTINKFGESDSSLTKSLNLTQREKEFLKHLCSEKSHKEIAEEMFVSPRTIDSYRDNLFEKLQVKSRVGLVIFAIKHKIVEI